MNTIVDLIEDALNEFGCMTCSCERNLVWWDFVDRKDIEEWLQKKELCPNCGAHKANYREMMGTSCCEGEK